MRSAPCDDLRTRSEAASTVFREGGRGGTAGELCEDGADDHPLKEGAGKLASLWGDRAGHSLAAAQPHLRALNRQGGAKLQVSEIREFALTDAGSARTDRVRLMPRASKAAADALMSRRWLAVVAEKPAFITSDDPVVLLRGSCWRPKYGLGSPGTIVNFAVSPFRFLVLADEWGRTVRSWHAGERQRLRS
jgi:hypothetical protein